MGVHGISWYIMGAHSISRYIDGSSRYIMGVHSISWMFTALLRHCDVSVTFGRPIGLPIGSGCGISVQGRIWVHIQCISRYIPRLYQHIPSIWRVSTYTMYITLYTWNICTYTRYVTGLFPCYVIWTGDFPCYVIWPCILRGVKCIPAHTLYKPQYPHIIQYMR